MTTDSLVKTVAVPVGRERAFALFVGEISHWWPLATHSVGEASATSVAIEPRVGGEIVETYGEGETSVWGTVTTWDPPGLVAFTWHPGTPAAEATQVEVTFAESGDSTVVTLTHTGWSSRPDGLRARTSYDSGWDFVLGRFVTYGRR